VGYRLLLDENVDREVGDRLAVFGHDIEYVTDVDELGAGTPDDALARYSTDDERAILTHDDDFVTTDHGADAVLFVADESMAAEDIAAVVDRMADAYPQEQVEGVQQVGREWL
jgi:predicted nuclease of predicted toxin-antitoxin system